MNKRIIGIALISGALAIALAALPGHSARVKSADECAKEAQTKVRAIQAQARQISQDVADQEESWEAAQEIEKMPGSGPRELRSIHWWRQLAGSGNQRGDRGKSQRVEASRRTWRDRGKDSSRQPGVKGRLKRK